MVWTVVGVWSVVAPTGAPAQQAELTDAQKLVELRMKLNTCTMQGQWMQNTMVSELRQTVERAEKAEAALALAQEELKKRGAAAPKQE
jgi:hypothetical protein